MGVMYYCTILTKSSVNWVRYIHDSSVQPCAAVQSSNEIVNGHMKVEKEGRKKMQIFSLKMPKFSNVTSFSNASSVRYHYTLHI